MHAQDLTAAEQNAFRHGSLPFDSTPELSRVTELLLRDSYHLASKRARLQADPGAPRRAVVD
jgi:hypothetical protein